MDPIVIAGAAAVVGSVLLVWWAVSGETTESLDLGRSDTPSHDLRERRLQQGASDRLAKPGFERVGWFIRNWTPTGRVSAMQRKLESAGSPAGWTVDRLLTVKLMLSIVLAGLVLLLVDLTVGGVLLVIAAAAIGYLVPDALLTRQVDARNQQI